MGFLGVYTDSNPKPPGPKPTKMISFQVGYEKVPLGGWAPRTDGYVVIGSPPIYFSHEFRPFGRGITGSLWGLRITMVINHLVNGMILQASRIPVTTRIFTYLVPIGSMGLVSLHEWLIFMVNVNVGKYTNPMDSMG